MKKTIILLTAMAAVLTACQKENPDVQNAVQKETAEAVDVAPLSFKNNRI